jgi:hypothetical protein
MSLREHTVIIAISFAVAIVLAACGEPQRAAPAPVAAAAE